MTLTTIEDLIESWHGKLEKIPINAHLLCPRLQDDDTENYDDLGDPETVIDKAEKKKRIEEGNDRLRITYWNSLILGYDQDKAGVWREYFIQRAQLCLRKCEKCVLNWHMCRKDYLSQFSERCDEYEVEHMTKCLEAFDHTRIDFSLDWALTAIELEETEGREFRKTALGDRQANVLLAVFEALCCMSYINHPGKASRFHKAFTALQPKKPLRLGSKVLLPAMTSFLFSERSNCRLFAKFAWEQIDDQELSEQQFDWAVSENLAVAVNNVSVYGPQNHDKYDYIERFWDGFLNILRTLSDSMILHRLRAMEVQPNIYDLLFQHMHCISERVLIAVIKALAALMHKSPKAFWDAIGDTRPFSVAEQVFMAPSFCPLLNNSLQLQDKGSQTFATISWITVWLQSLDRDRKHDACESLLHTLLDIQGLLYDINLGKTGRAACVRAGLDGLTITLKAFIDSEMNTDNAMLYTNSTLNLVLKYINTIFDNTKQHNANPELGLTEAAKGVVSAALTLDAKATAEEYIILACDKSLNKAVTRKSSDLWEAFIPLLDEGQAAVARIFLMALLPFIGIEKVRLQRKSSKPLEPTKRNFNTEMDKMVDAIRRIFWRVTEFGHDELSLLCGDPQNLRPIFGFCLNGEEDISQAAVGLIEAITGQDGRSDAMSGMLQDIFRDSLNSFTYSIQATMQTPFPWGPMNPILRASQDVLNGLCNPSSGILRLKSLSGTEVDAVLRWWNGQWRCVSDAFHQAETWSHFIEIAIMSEFCRDVIELANNLLSQDGLIVSAIDRARDHSRRGQAADGRSSLTRVLEPCHNYCLNVIKMIRLRDYYLVDLTVKVLVKLFRRLRDNSIMVDTRPRNYIQDACAVTPDGKYLIATNLSDQQRAELLDALGLAGDGNEALQTSIASTSTLPASTINIASIPTSSIPSGKAPKQSTIETWAKSGSSSSVTSPLTRPQHRSNRDDILELSNSVDKHGSILGQMAAHQAQLKPRPKPVVDSPRITMQAKQAAFIEGRHREKAERDRVRKEMAAKAKEHALARKSDIMVGSSDEEDEDEANQLNDYLVKSVEAQKGADAAEQRRRLDILAFKAREPVKKAKLLRSAKDMRARVNPNMDQLFQTVLEWDLFHEGADPPAGETCKQVSPSYQTTSLYKETFYPLLVYEAWRSFVTSKEETTSKPIGVRIATRMNVDSFLEVTASMPAPDVRDKEKRQMEGDIILLSQVSDAMNEKSASHCLARVSRTTFKKGNMEITYRLSNKANTMLAVLRPGVDIYSLKITNMTTIEREYAAMESLQWCELRDEVLSARPSPILKFGEQRVKEIVSKYALNPAQAKAVLCATDNDAFTLIQGPPGTGKTKTIVAMVGALLTESLSKAKRSLAHAIPMAGNAQGNDAKNVGKKLLVCAPSNAAVDELVLRLKQGITTLDGRSHQIKVIRLGRSDNVNVAVKDVTLDELIRLRLESDATKETLSAKRDAIHTQAGTIKADLTQLRPRLEEAKTQGNQIVIDSLSREFERLKHEEQCIRAKIDAEKDSSNATARQLEIKRGEIRREILNAADVLCATLSGSGHDMFRNLMVEFETVIIDEAAQCVELSALIPLKYGCLKCILVGDPKQLPPTVLSRSAAEFGYDQSLFVRMQQNKPGDVHLLDHQYRMHPEISLFPSREFYEGRLVDGDDMAKVRNQPWHASGVLGPYRFFDVKGIQSKGQMGKSLVNQAEVRVAMQLYTAFSQNYDTRGKIGIITPYNAQLFELRASFTSRFGQEITQGIDFNTTDAFQGRECEVIIFSCVRASPTGGIGFMNDIRRMNVGLTRARSSLWILGDSRALAQGQFWARLMENARQRGLYSDGDIVDLLRRVVVKRIEAPLSSMPDVVMTDVPPLELGKPPARGAEASLLGRKRPLEAPSDQSGKRMTISKPRSYTRPPNTVAPPHSAAPRFGGSVPAEKQEGPLGRFPSQRSPPLTKPVESGPSGDASTKPTEQSGQSALSGPASASSAPAPKPLVPPRRKAPVDPFIRKRPVGKR